MLEENRNWGYGPRENITFDSSLPLVLTHLDLLPQNIIVGADSRVYVIDWETAGFYPQWFEYVGMMQGWDILGRGRWRRLIVGFIAGFYERQAQFFRSIQWAVNRLAGWRLWKEAGH